MRHIVKLLVSSIIVSLVFALMSNSVRAKSCGNSVERVHNRVQPTRFSPVRLLRSKGIEPEKVVILRTVENPFEFIIYYKQSYVGGAVFGKRGKKVWFRIVDLETAETKRNFTGKGIGPTLYLGLAKLLYDESGRVLEKSNDTSDRAEHIWEQLVSRGYAETFGQYSEHARFREDVLKGNQLDLALRFVQERLNPVPEFAVTVVDQYGFEPPPILASEYKLRDVLAGDLKEIVED